MRTTKKELAAMYRELRQAVGVRTNAQAWKRVSEANDFFKSKIDSDRFGAVMLTPYADNCWILTAVPKRESGIKSTTVRLYLSLQQWLVDAAETASEFNSKAW